MKSFKSSLTFPQDNILSLWLESLSVLWLHPYFITARILSPLPSPCFAAYLPPIAGDTPFGFQPAVARSASSRAKKQTIRMVKPPCSHSISISQPHHIHIFHCQAWEWQTHSGLHQVTLKRGSRFPPHIKRKTVLMLGFVLQQRFLALRLTQLSVVWSLSDTWTEKTRQGNSYTFQ